MHKKFSLNRAPANNAHPTAKYARGGANTRSMAAIVITSSGVTSGEPDETAGDGCCDEDLDTGGNSETNHCNRG